MLVQDVCIRVPFLEPGSVSMAVTLHTLNTLHCKVYAAALTGYAEGINDIEVVSLKVSQLNIPALAS